MKPIQGLHHITAVSSDPHRNVQFYHHVLGQRLVKKTVNFDDPGTYHFYFADEVGSPGTIMTFFPWQRMRPGVLGNGETSHVGYAVPVGSLDYWRERLKAHGVTYGQSQIRFGQTVLPFKDPDGMNLELVESAEPATISHWTNGSVLAEKALRGFHSVTLLLSDVEATGSLLTQFLGYEFVSQEGNRHRYRAAGNDLGLYVDLLHRPDGQNGRFGAGSIHHIAFRTVDDSEQQEYLQLLRRAGFQVTPVQDRQYFHSIYFRSPGGVLFEVATDAPGFLYDEPVAELGQSLKLPPWLESQRAQIAERLPEISLDEGQAA
ncbi:MAG: ring-cleaving dioxygenase [Chloroflexota bacterium]